MLPFQVTENQTTWIDCSFKGIRGMFPITSAKNKRPFPEVSSRCLSILLSFTWEKKEQFYLVKLLAMSHFMFPLLWLVTSEPNV